MPEIVSANPVIFQSGTINIKYNDTTLDLRTEQFKLDDNEFNDLDNVSTTVEIHRLNSKPVLFPECKDILKIKEGEFLDKDKYLEKRCEVTSRLHNDGYLRLSVNIHRPKKSEPFRLRLEVSSQDQTKIWRFDSGDDETIDPPLSASSRTSSPTSIKTPLIENFTVDFNKNYPDEILLLIERSSGDSLALQGEASMKVIQATENVILFQSCQGGFEKEFEEFYGQSYRFSKSCTISCSARGDRMLECPVRIQRPLKGEELFDLQLMIQTPNLGRIIFEHSGRMTIDALPRLVAETNQNPDTLKLSASIDGLASQYYEKELSIRAMLEVIRINKDFILFPRCGGEFKAYGGVNFSFMKSCYVNCVVQDGEILRCLVELQHPSKEPESFKLRLRVPALNHGKAKVFASERIDLLPRTVRLRPTWALRVVWVILSVLAMYSCFLLWRLRKPAMVGLEIDSTNWTELDPSHGCNGIIKFRFLRTTKEIFFEWNNKSDQQGIKARLPPPTKSIIATNGVPTALEKFSFLPLPFVPKSVQRNFSFRIEDRFRTEKSEIRPIKIKVWEKGKSDKDELMSQEWDLDLSFLPRKEKILPSVTQFGGLLVPQNEQLVTESSVAEFPNGSRQEPQQAPLEQQPGSPATDLNPRKFQARSSRPLDTTQGQVLILKAVNRWWESDLERREFLTMMETNSEFWDLQLYRMRDTAKVLDRLGTPAFIFEPDLQNGAWLWVDLTAEGKALAVPADRDFITLGSHQVNVVARLFEGIPTRLSKESYFQQVERPCHLRQLPQSPNQYEVVQVGKIKISDRRRNKMYGKNQDQVPIPAPDLSGNSESNDATGPASSPILAIAHDQHFIGERLKNLEVSMREINTVVINGFRQVREDLREAKILYQDLIVSQEELSTSTNIIFGALADLEEYQKDTAVEIKGIGNLIEQSKLTIFCQSEKKVEPTGDEGEHTTSEEIEPVTSSGSEAGSFEKFENSDPSSGLIDELPEKLKNVTEGAWEIIRRKGGDDYLQRLIAFKEFMEDSFSDLSINIVHLLLRPGNEGVFSIHETSKNSEGTIVCEACGRVSAIREQLFISLSAGGEQRVAILVPLGDIEYNWFIAGYKVLVDNLPKGKSTVTSIERPAFLIPESDDSYVVDGNQQMELNLEITKEDE